MTDDQKPPLDHKVKRPFVWIPASSHSDPALFKARMDKRMQQAHEQREQMKQERADKVRPLSDYIHPVPGRFR